jgi:hypothetical protein
VPKPVARTSRPRVTRRGGGADLRTGKLETAKGMRAFGEARGGTQERHMTRLLPDAGTHSWRWTNCCSLPTAGAMQSKPDRPRRLQQHRQRQQPTENRRREMNDERVDRSYGRLCPPTTVSELDYRLDLYSNMLVGSCALGVATICAYNYFRVNRRQICVGRRSLH